MSKSNVEKAIYEILSDEQCLPDFLACEDQEELYEYCLSKSGGYTREEFDEFVEETIAKAEKEIDRSSFKTEKKIGQVFSKVLAASLAVFSAMPMVQNLAPQIGAYDYNSYDSTPIEELVNELFDKNNELDSEDNISNELDGKDKENNELDGKDKENNELDGKDKENKELDSKDDNSNELDCKDKENKE
ncbi:MAG: hypothetical protein LBJ32_03185, partial [Oscillospiraceae bacterium]|nr:hypothetical protein [Oscillospiraceae bacterium]